jgi:subtilisin family serine protease
VAQEDCAAVKNCGGWLRHPDVVKSCDRVCECVFGGAAIAARWSGGLAPPPGYAWSDDALAVESAGRSLDLGPAGTATVEGAGRFQVIRFQTTPSEATLDRVGEALRVLPTFRDAGGRFAAATGVIHVRAKDEAARAKAGAALAARGLTPLAPAFPGARVLRSEGDPWAALAALHELKGQGVEAELDMLRTYERRSVPNDPRFPDQWHLKNTGQNGATVGVDGRVDEAWDVTQGDPQVVVAINDDGVDLNHPDLKDNLLGALNFPEDWETRLQIGTFGGHGTPCAGVAAARGDNALAGSGVCPRCKILPHLLGETQGISFAVTDEDVAKGFVAMVDAGAWVISNSWGPSGGDPNFDGNALIPLLSPVVKEAFDYAETKGRGGKGTVILFAAGNSNALFDNYSSYETNLAVGAVDDTGLKSYYSSFGPGMDISAPSNGGLQGITTTSPSTGGDGVTDSFGGTSSACPFVAGVAGLVLSANPELTAAEVRSILKKTARKIDQAGGEYNEEGESPFYGAGLVNAAAAVRMAKGLCNGADCVAPSDVCQGDCDRDVCGACRTDADCKEGLVCQAAPGLAAQVCVAKAPPEGCPANTTFRGGYCVPDRTFCGACQAAETCNASDDNCDGAREEGLEGCATARRCLDRDEDCGEGEVCAATICVKACKKDADCEGTGRCRKTKTRYGKTKSAKGCGLDPLRACKIACESVASTVEDESRENFTGCMKDGEAACGTVFSCISTLPISSPGGGGQ